MGSVMGSNARTDTTSAQVDCTRDGEKVPLTKTLLYSYKWTDPDWDFTEGDELYGNTMFPPETSSLLHFTSLLSVETFKWYIRFL